MAREEYEDEEYEEEEEEYEEEEEDEEEDDEEDELSADEMIEIARKDILKRMRKICKTSEEYAVLSQRLGELTEQKRDADEAAKDRAQTEEMRKQRWVPYFQIAGNIVGNAVGSAVGQMFNRRTVNDVLECERDGHIISTKATTFMQKPRN